MEGVIIKKHFENLFNVHLNISVLIASVVSIVFGMITTLISSEGAVSLKIFVIYICISLFIIWLLLIIIFSPSKLENTSLSLNLVRFLTDNKGSVFCIIKPCSYVSIGSYLTFFYLDNELEIYLATGVISNIQNNNMIKVDMLTSIEDVILLNKTKNNNVDFIKSIVVKPIITNNFFKEERYND